MRPPGCEFVVVERPFLPGWRPVRDLLDACYDDDARDHVVLALEVSDILGESSTHIFPELSAPDHDPAYWTTIPIVACRRAGVWFVSSDLDEVESYVAEEAGVPLAEWRLLRGRRTENRRAVWEEMRAVRLSDGEFMLPMLITDARVERRGDAWVVTGNLSWRDIRVESELLDSREHAEAIMLRIRQHRPQR